MLIRRWVPFIRSLNTFLLANPVSDDMKVWRRSSITAAQAAELLDDCQYRTFMYIATSTTETTARNFSGKPNSKYVWELTIDAGCMQACNISSLSQFGVEDEVLLVPYSVVRVSTVQRALGPDGVTTIYAHVERDAREISVSLPSVAM